MTHRLAFVVTSLALLAPVPAGASAAAPPGFIGLSPQGVTDFALIADARVSSVRLSLAWNGVERQNPAYRAPDWSGFDQAVASAADHGIQILPSVWGTPRWVAPQPRVEPINTAWERQSWMAFLRLAVARYGPYGTFWADHPELPFLPIRSWEVWNEENIVTFSNRPNPDRFARLMKVSARALHNADPGAKVLLGGLFGQPLQGSPNVLSSEFLDRVYGAGAGWAIDGVALHPYVVSPAAIGPQVESLRRVMRRYGAGGTPLYVTELGWGSNSGQSRWEQGYSGQARDLDQAFSLLSNHRLGWRIAGVYWFSLMDVRGPSCQFCDSAGLLTADGEAKPAWYRFNAWTGGDADAVPRLLLLPSG